MFAFLGHPNWLTIAQIVGSISLYVLWRWDRHGEDEDVALIPLEPVEVLFLGVLAILAFTVIGSALETISSLYELALSPTTLLPDIVLLQ